MIKSNYLFYQPGVCVCVCVCVCVLVAKSCPTLFDPVDCSLPGLSVHGSLQARILEWVAIQFSQGMVDFLYSSTNYLNFSSNK